MKIFKVITACILTFGLTTDFLFGFNINMIYLFALIAVLFT